MGNGNVHITATCRLCGRQEKKTVQTMTGEVPLISPGCDCPRAPGLITVDYTMEYTGSWKEA